MSVAVCLAAAPYFLSLNPVAIAFTLLNAIGVLLLPRGWAFVPLIAGACFVSFGQVVHVGPFSFTIIRLLVAAGVLRVLIRRERLPGGVIGLDLAFIAWAIWACISSAFHADPKSDLIYKLGQSYDACGLYFLARSFCVSLPDVFRLCRIIAVILVPVALGMLYEHVAMYNWFSMFGGVPATPMVRNGTIRSFGPFMHPILAGTVGACVLPLMIGLWRIERLAALIGSVACLAMVLASGSSGPVMSALAGVAALCLWPLRFRMRAVRWLGVAVYLGLELVMKVPAYYIISRLDVTGSSTGWHRAALIESALKHLGEWWLAGTDYTRHWMPTGVSWSPNHTDITSHYLNMGVIGGLPLLGLFITWLVVAFRYVGGGIRMFRGSAERWLVWALGAALFAQTVTCISVAYFDQSVVFLYLTLAALGAVGAAMKKSPRSRSPVHKRSVKALARTNASVQAAV